ncbi:MAG: helix-turn-helix transcriptional regulator [Bacteroidota bacterium]
MEKKLAHRIKELRSHYNMGIKEFGVRCGLSHVAIFHLENGRTVKPQKSSLQRIINVFGTTNEWMLHGIGDMLPNGIKDLEVEKEAVSFWKDEAYLELKSKNLLLEKEVERLWQMVSHFTSGIKPNFHRTLEN